VLDLDGENLALANFGNCFEHLGCLLFKPEVREGSFAARTVLAANLELSNDPGRGLERGLSRFDPQAFDPAEIQVLEQFNKATLRFRQRGFAEWQIQLGTPFAKSKELPEGLEGESSDCSPFLALSSQRQSNAFEKEALRPA
jgi:hypothetical protein